VGGAVGCTAAAPPWFPPPPPPPSPSRTPSLFKKAYGGL